MRNAARARFSHTTARRVRPIAQAQSSLGFQVAAGGIVPVAFRRTVVECPARQAVQGIVSVSAALRRDVVANFIDISNSLIRVVQVLYRAG